MSWLVLACACLIGSGFSQVGRVTEVIDLIEINHYQEANGRLSFDQVILYDWSHRHRAYVVRDYKVIRSPFLYPYKDWETGTIRMRWREDGIVQEVVGSNWRETWTKYDPEKENTQIVPRSDRVGLIRPLALQPQRTVKR